MNRRTLLAALGLALAPAMAMAQGSRLGVGVGAAAIALAQGRPPPALATGPAQAAAPSPAAPAPTAPPAATADAPVRPAAPATTAAPAQAQPAPTAGPVQGLRVYAEAPAGQTPMPQAENAVLETRRQLLMAVVFDPALNGQVFHARARAVNTSESNSYMLVEGDAPVTDGMIVLRMNRDRNWAVGEYAVVVSQSGREVTSLPFFVRPTAPRNTPITVGEITTYRITSTGQSEPAAQLQAADRGLLFGARAQGSRTDGARVAWVLTAVETTAGPTQQAAHWESAAQIIENGELNFTITLPRDWPVGRYRVALTIDGAPAASREFTIAP